MVRVFFFPTARAENDDSDSDDDDEDGDDYDNGECSLLLITRRQILDSSKLKEFVDDNLKFDENGRKLSEWVENTVGKGEMAGYEQFLLFPQCFQKACFVDNKF